MEFCGFHISIPQQSCGVKSMRGWRIWRDADHSLPQGERSTHIANAEEIIDPVAVDLHLHQPGLISPELLRPQRPGLATEPCRTKGIRMGAVATELGIGHGSLTQFQLRQCIGNTPRAYECDAHHGASSGMVGSLGDNLPALLNGRAVSAALKHAYCRL
jgi:hypothetical protein